MTDGPGNAIRGGPVDPGAQNERTALAWTRTALALLAGVVIASRIAADELGAIAVVFGVAVAPFATLIVLLARRRYRTAHRALRSGRTLPDGILPAMVAAVVLLLALLEGMYAIAG